MDNDKDKSPEDNIPLADDDPQGMFWTIDLWCIFVYILHLSIFKLLIIAIIHDDQDISQSSNIIVRNQSMDSLQSSFTNGSSSPSRNSKYLFINFKHPKFS